MWPMRNYSSFLGFLGIIIYFDIRFIFLLLQDFLLAISFGMLQSILSMLLPLCENLEPRIGNIQALVWALK